MTFKRLSANKLALSLAVTSALGGSFVTANAAEQDTQAQENIEVISVTGLAVVCEALLKAQCR